MERALGLFIGLALIATLSACGGEANMVGADRASSYQAAPAAGAATSSDEVASHPRDPSKPGDNEEAIPGYLTDPESIQRRFDVDVDIAFVRGDAAALDFGDQEEVVVSLWHIAPEELYSSDVNKQLTEFVFDLGMRQFEELNNQLFGFELNRETGSERINALSLSAKRVAKTIATKEDGFALKTKYSSGILVLSVSPSADETRLSVLDNRPGKIAQMVFMPGEIDKLVAFDRHSFAN